MAKQHLRSELFVKILPKKGAPLWNTFIANIFNHSMTAATRPDPAVRLPSRIRLGEPWGDRWCVFGFFVIIFFENTDFLCVFIIFVATIKISHVAYYYQFLNISSIILESKKF